MIFLDQVRRVANKLNLKGHSASMDAILGLNVL